MNIRKKLSLAALCFTLPAMASAQAAAAPAAPPAVTITPYGFILLDAFFDQGKFAANEYPAQVVNEDQGAFIMQIRQSRFGVNFAGGDSGFTGAQLAAKVEGDFFAGHLPTVSVANAVTAPTSNKLDSAIPRLRYAFATATWSVGPGKLQLLAGQTDGVVNPLHPDSNAYAASPGFMQAGNLYRRSPQIRVQYDYKVMDMLSVQAQVAAVSPQDGEATGFDWGAGNKSGPDYEARLAFMVKPTADISGTVGFGYHMNKRVYPSTITVTTGAPTTATIYAKDGTTESFTAKLFGIDFNADVTKYLNVRGEWYQGKGIDDVYSGIISNAGYDSNLSAAVYAPDGIRSTGYWFQAAIKPIPEVTLLGGMGSAQVNKDDLVNSKGALPAATTNAAGSIITSSTQREKNTELLLGVTAQAGKNWRFGIEYAKTTTKYWSKYESPAANSTLATAANPAYPALKPEMSASQIALSSRFSF
jgi:hypothetical protein